MLSFFFYLLLHEPVKMQGLYYLLTAYPSPTPSYQAFSGPFFYLLLHFSSFTQQAHSKDLALGPYCHLDELSHDFNWNLAFRRMWESAFMFRAEIRNEIILGPSWLRFWIIDSESWGSWGPGYLMKIFVYNLTINSMVKTSH